MFVKYFYINLIDTIRIMSVVKLNKKKLSYVEYSITPAIISSY